MPGIVATGTALFYGIGILAMLLSYGCSPPGSDKGLYATLIMLVTVCTWLLWVITFMMQVNPLIYPQVVFEESG